MNLPTKEKVGEGVMLYVQCRLGGYVGCERVLVSRILVWPGEYRGFH